MGIVKIFFHPTWNSHRHRAGDVAVPDGAEADAARHHPAAHILNYNASTVPILQLGLSSPTLAEKHIFDLGQNFIRPALASVPGAAIPSPYGGRERQIQIDLNPQALQADGLSAQDLENALAAQNQIIPAGTIKVGDFEYNVNSTTAPRVEELNKLPIKQVERRRRSTWAMWRMCMTARRLSAMKCAWMATARC